MKHKSLGRGRTLIALLLTASMLFSMCSTIFATSGAGTMEERPVIHYVSLGDSMTNGYGFVGYMQSEDVDSIFDLDAVDEHGDTGKGVYGKGAYPLLLEALLEADGYDVKHTKLALSATRAEDVYYLLSDDLHWPVDKWGLPSEDALNGDAGFRDYVCGLKHECGQSNPDHYVRDCDPATKLLFQSAIEDADLISMALGNASFGAWIQQNIVDLFGVLEKDGKVTDKTIEAFKQFEERLDDSLAMLASDKDVAAIMQIYDYLKASLAEYNLSGDMFDSIVNLITYTATNYIIGYKGTLTRISELKGDEDVDVILVGLFNTLEGVEISGLDGMVEGNLPVGEIMGEVFNILNAYVAGLPTVMQAVGEWENINFYYAEVDEMRYIADDLQHIQDEHWNAQTCVADDCILDAVTIRNRTMSFFNDDIYPMIRETIGDLIAEQVAMDALSGAVVTVTLPDLEPVKAGCIANLGEDSLHNGCSCDFVEIKINGQDAEDAEVAEAVVSGIKVACCNTIAQVYLGIEDAIVDSIEGEDGKVLNANGLAKFFVGDGLAGVFGENFNLNDIEGDGIRAKLRNYILGNVLDMAKFCALAYVGEGVSCHTSPESHLDIANAAYTAYTEGHTAADETVANLKEAYKYAYAQAVANGYIAQAQGYIDVAIDGVETAIAFVEETEVDAQFDAVKAELLKELDATVDTLEEIKAVLGEDNIDDTWAAILALEEDLDAHRDNILALADEIGIAVDPYIDQFIDTVNYYADLVETIANDAYAWIVNGVEEFGEEYAAWVESVGQLADKVSPALGTAVREYLTETPAEALAIIYAAGDDAVTEFIAAAAAASDDIKVILTAIAAILESDIEAVADAVYNSEQVQGIIDRIDEIKTEIETVKDEMLKYPVSSALAYEEILNALEDQLISFQSELVDAIIEVIDEEVDPAVSDMLRKSFEALQDIVDVAENAGSQYGDWFDGRFDQMVGDLLTLIIDNTLELGAVTDAVIEDIINDLINDVKDFIDNIEFEDIDLSEIYALIDELKAVANDINAVLNALKEYADDEIAAIVAELENTLEKVNDFVAQLEAFAQNVENVINEIENKAELTVEKVKAIVAQVEELAAEAEALINEANASLKLLAAAYEKLIPYISELLNCIEEGSPVDVFLDTTDMEVEEFIAVVTSGYEDTIAAIETAAANIDAIVLDTMDVVCLTIADAVEEIVAATETAVNDITEVVTPALDTIKTEAIKLSSSTNAKIAEAGKQLYALVEAVELTYSESAFLAKQDEIEAIVDDFIATLESVETIDDVKAALAQTGDVLAALGNVAEDIYEIAEGDVMKLITTANTLAKQVETIVTITAGSIHSDALAAYGESAAAIFATVDPVIEVIGTAIDAYEETVLEAAGVIIEAVTEAADNIGNEVVAAADIMIEAAAEIAETTESGIESIKDALEYVVYDTTHGEYTIDYDSYYVALGTSDYAAALAEKLGLEDKYAQFGLDEDYLDEAAEADLVTVTFDMDNFVTFAYAQAMGMVVEVVKANEDLAGLLNGRFGDIIVEYMTEMGIDLNAKVEELDWSKFDTDVIKAKDEILSIAETVLSEQIEELVVVFDLGAELASPDLLGFDPDIKVEIPVLELAVTALENVLYGYFEFAVEFPAVLNNIREVAPDAQVAVTGLINPTEALQAVLPAELNIDLSAVAEYVDSVVAVLNHHLFVYAAINTNTTYVENIDADSIYNALEITRGGLLGDANLDGIVDMFDAQLILEYYVDLIDANEIALYLADVNADNIIDMFDAQLILEYYVGLITVFPAE